MAQSGEAAKLLRWYDANARVLPWRVPPGVDQAANPYHVWLSEIMLQQTTVAAVKSYFQTFTRRWPTVQDLAAADDADVMSAWAGLGYYARARNLLKAARILAALEAFPDTEADLRALPGIGPYTAAAIAAIAFGRRAVVVDGNIERVIARYFDLRTPLPEVKSQIKTRADDLTPQDRGGDYAQAAMDLGALICTPKSPDCRICPWHDGCRGRIAGTAASLPARKPKARKPTRFGSAYYGVRRDGSVLLERRPERGLLGGMLGFPSTQWAETRPEPQAPAPADWVRADRDVTHVFTHFRLELTIYVAILDDNVNSNAGEFVPRDSFSSQALPTVFRKVYDVGQDRLAQMQ